MRKERKCDQTEKKSKIQRLKQYISENKIMSGIVVFLLICILGMSGSTSSAMDQSSLLESKAEEQLEQIKNLEKQIDDFSERYEELQVNYDKLCDEVSVYQNQQETIDDLNTSLSELQEKYDKLLSEKEKLSEENSELEVRVSSAKVKSASSASAVTGSESGRMVWLSATGSKYHSIPDCGNMNPNKARQVSKSSAEAQGYSACSKCW